MATKFYPLNPMTGFDAAANPPWQMVPLGSYRWLGLTEARNLTLVTSDSSVIRVTLSNAVAGMPAGSVAVCVQGLKRGRAYVTVRRTGATATICQLEVNVKPAKGLYLAFNFVRDIANHRTNRATASVDNLLNTMNSIYYPQANVYFAKRSSRWVTVNRNLGSVVRYSKHLSGVAASEHEWDVVVAQRDNAAHWNVFFVWEFEMDNTPSVDGADAANSGANCIFEDNAGVDIGETLAHEIGHFFGCSDYYTANTKDWLMYGYTDVRGRSLPKAHVNQINP